MGTTLTTPNNTNDYQVANALIPKEGPRCVPFVVPFAQAPGPYVIDLQQMVALKRMTVVQSLFVDNSAASTPVTIAVAGSNQEIVCPEGCQGYFPVLTPLTPRFTISSSGSANVNLIFANVPVPSAVWSATSETSIADEANGPVTPGTPATQSKLAGAIYYASGTAPAPVAGEQQALQIDSSGNLLVNAGLGTALLVPNAYVSALRVTPAFGIGAVSLASASTTTPATPASTQLLAAGTSGWTYIGIQAPTTADVWINPRGGTAGVDAADCFRIPSGTLWESKFPAIGGPITYYCATGGLQLNCLYG